jgi:hypothetical protein
LPPWIAREPRYSEDWADLRLVLHRHVCDQHPCAASLRQRTGASWTDLRFIPGADSDTSLKVGAILEFGLIFTNIATAVVLYPLARRQSETVALG